MNKSIVIYTETSLPNINDFFNSDYMIILKPNMNINLIDNYSLLLNNEYLYYDCLITDEIETLKKLNAIFDNDFVLTNNTFLSSIDNVFCYGKLVNTSKTIEEQLKIIVDSILNNE